jgi:Flp pilus assembly protein TadD
MATPLYVPPTAPLDDVGSSFWASTTLGIARITWAMIAIIAALGMALYGHTLSFPFQFDDLAYVSGNPLVKDLKNFGAIFDIAQVYQTVVAHQLPDDVAANFVLRPFAYFTFAMNFAMGGLNPVGYRLTNVILHGINAFLLFQVLRLFMRSARGREAAPECSIVFIPLVAALLFFVHPMQVESVTYIVQRFDILATLFYLGTLWLYFTANLAESGRRRVALRVVSVITLVLGMLSKETMFTAPVMLVLLDHWLMGAPWRTALRRAWPHLLCLAILPCILMAVASVRAGRDATLLDAICVASPGGSHWIYPYHYALTQVRVVVAYLWLLLVPKQLNVDWDVTESTSAGDWRVWVCGGVILAILAWAWIFHGRRKADVRHRMIFTFTAWYFVTLSVSSSIVPLPDAMAEHRVYLASLGVMTALACAADFLRTRVAKTAIFTYSVPVAVVFWVSALSGATLLRNEVWRSTTRLWADAVAKSPGKFRAWGNLGVTYMEAGKVGEAAACFMRAIELRPDYGDAYRNLSGALVLLKKYPEAVQVSDRGLLCPGDAKAALYFNRAQALREMGRTNEALRSMQESLDLAPQSFLTTLALAELYAQRDDLVQARQLYAVAANLRPGDDRLSASRAYIESRRSVKPIARNGDRARSL